MLGSTSRSSNSENRLVACLIFIKENNILANEECRGLLEGKLISLLKFQKNDTIRAMIVKLLGESGCECVEDDDVRACFKNGNEEENNGLLLSSAALYVALKEHFPDLNVNLVRGSKAKTQSKLLKLKLGNYEQISEIKQNILNKNINQNDVVDVTNCSDFDRFLHLLHSSS